MKIKILTLFPEMLEGPLHSSILGRAIEAGLIDVELIDIRAYAKNKHRNADDYPFGGGAGMVMLPQPIVDAVEANALPGTRRIYLSPRGRTFSQRIAEEYARYDSLLLLCGHYEGVDQRALDLCIDEELSIGDYVLTGGELAALIVVDAVARLIPGVLGSEESSGDESFTTGLLEYPQYTRPAEFRGMRVPEILLNGNHAHIEAWRRRQSLKLTRERRPELLQTAPLSDADREELRKLERTEEILTALAGDGVRAERLEMLEEAGYAKEWFARIVPEAQRSKAKKQCFSGRRHVGWLYQAFEMGYVPCERGEEAEARFAALSGGADAQAARFSESVARVTPCSEAAELARGEDVEFSQVGANIATECAAQSGATAAQAATCGAAAELARGENVEPAQPDVNSASKFAARFGGTDAQAAPCGDAEKPARGEAISPDGKATLPGGEAIPPTGQSALADPPILPNGDAAHSGAAVLYLNRENLAFRVENPGALRHLPRLALLTAADFSRCFARSGRGELYSYSKESQAYSKETEANLP